MGIFDKLKGSKKAKAASAVDAPSQEDKTTVEKRAEALKEEAKSKDSINPKGSGQFANDVLIRPVITEKSLQQHTIGQYSFYVATDASKHQVKMAIKELYGVNPMQVRMVKKKPTQIKRWGRLKGMTKASKKAIVTLPKGTTLNLTE